jgi:hypothetical protein
MKIVNDRSEFLKDLSLYAIQDYCSFVEIGVFRGDFSKMILDIIRPSKLYLIDPFEHSIETYGEGQITTAYSDEEDYQIVKNRFRYEIQKNQIIINRGYSFDVVEHYSDNSFDFIYHDGSHLYKDLKRDLNEWLPKLKEGGIMAGHDHTENYKDHVGKAVNEFCFKHQFEIILYNKNGGDYALRRK